MSAQREVRPGWVWAIAIWYFGGTALLILFAILIYNGAIHLAPAQQVRWDNAPILCTRTKFCKALHSDPQTAGCERPLPSI
jgi:hypothetical protein